MSTPYSPSQLTSRIVAWLEDNPGAHRPIEVARALDSHPNRTASILLYLAKNDRVERVKGRTNNGPGSSTYRAKDTVSI